MSTPPKRDESTRSPTIGEFETFYRNYYNAISRYVARRVPQDSHDEVVATTFAAAWRKFAIVKSPSLPWLYRIASFEVSHERRRLGRHGQVVELNDLHLIDTAPMDEVFDASMAFHQLSESDAELLRLIYWEDLSRSEIAEVLGLSVNAVNVRYHRSLDRLLGAINRASSSERTNPLNDTSRKEIQ
jgi:RNA polymerase sigma-70 factor (ECF subfamily)